MNDGVPCRLYETQTPSIHGSAVGLCGPVLDERPPALRLLDGARLPLPARLLARPHLPGLVHRRRPLRLLRRQEQQPLRAAGHQVSANRKSLKASVCKFFFHVTEPLDIIFCCK